LVSSEGEKHWLRVVQDKVLREVFRLKREKVTRDWRKLHSENLHDLSSTPSIIWMITSRQKRWVVHVACMRKKRNAHCFGREMRGKENTWKT